MFAFILNRHGKVLVLCDPPKAKKLLRLGKVKIVKRSPFTFGSSGYKQKLIAGMDAGSKVNGKAIHNPVKVKAGITRLLVRNIALTAMKHFDSTNRCLIQGISIAPGLKESRFPGGL